MALAESTILSRLLDWLLYIVVGIVGFISMRQFKQDKILQDQKVLIALLEQRASTSETTRSENMQRLDRELKSINDRIDSHHKIMMSRLDTLFGASD